MLFTAGNTTTVRILFIIFGTKGRAPGASVRSQRYRNNNDVRMVSMSGLWRLTAKNIAMLWLTIKF